METIEKILGTWPNQAILAKDLRVSYSTVAKWRARSSIPGAYWKRIVDSAQIRRLNSVTLEALALAHAADIDQRSISDADAEPIPKKDLSVAADKGTGYFSRYRHLRKRHFATTEEIVDHVRGLRDEWDRR